MTGGIASRAPDQILPVAANDLFRTAAAEKTEVEIFRTTAPRSRPLDQPRKAIDPSRMDEGRHFRKYEFRHVLDGTVIS